MPDFGIGEFLAAAGTFIGTTAPEAIGSALAGAGIGSATAGAIGSGLVDATIGAGLGAGEAAITGGDPGLGALTGGITGGAVGGLGGVLGSTLGIGAIGGDVLAGAAGGALGSGITGGNALTGALGGGASGLAAGLLAGDTPGGAPASGTTAPGPSAAAIAPAGGIGGATDLTAGLDTAAITDPTLGGLTGAPASSFAVGTSAGPNLGSVTAGTSALGGASPELGSVTAGTSTLGAPAGITPAGSVTQSGLPPAAAAGKTSAFDTALSNPSAGNILKALGANAGPIVAGGGLLESIMGGQSNLTGLNELKGQAGALASEGATLSSYLGSGQLPAGAQAGLNQATKAAQAAVRSKYASMGMSGSTAEVQDLNNITEQAQAQQFQIADSLLKTGMDATNTSAQIYGQLLNFDQKQSADTGAAIASLAAALSGSSGGVRLNIGGGAGG